MTLSMMDHTMYVHAPVAQSSHAEDQRLPHIGRNDTKWHQNVTFTVAASLHVQLVGLCATPGSLWQLSAASTFVEVLVLNYEL